MKCEEGTPEGWHEVADPDARVERHDPESVRLFVHGEQDLSVQVGALDLRSPDEADRTYRLSVVRDREAGRRKTTEFAGLADRRAALAAACRFMSAYSASEDPSVEAVESAMAAVERE
ncbi:hypothetical protein [Halegenticoccus soli]|uniref:hypothetical protein n=1 Tax=Halegenticoccus soli TaxID=1985678 RepID=UPI000C6CE3FC|nr:hypothetical protein [Halegenticoccus soli]